jgi:monoamine oxidase
VTKPYDVLVIGAGVAGLAAAERLSRAGARVAILEGRSRIGGRVFTRHLRGWPLPVELGAEFVHGESPELFELAREAGLLIDRLPTRNADASRRGARWQPLGDVWKEFDRMTRAFRRTGRDRSVAEFLRAHRSWPVKRRRLLASIVEGYDAASLEDASEHALSTAGEPPRTKNERAQFRVISGYDGVPKFLASRLDARRVRLFLGTPVRTISWRRGFVEARVEDGRRWRARRAIVTVPIGVLKAPPGALGAIAFDPDPRPIRRALEGIEMGHVARLVLRFREPFWDDEGFLDKVGASGPVGFIHRFSGDFPTWWTAAPSRTPMLVAWSGGPRAPELLALRSEDLLDLALRVLGRTSRTRPASLRRLLRDHHIHDWTRDPFSRGAYSYERVGGAESPKALARPVEDTLYFAGEATEGAEGGTVPAALKSGRRAAERITR